jgi:hypothetical protein
LPKLTKKKPTGANLVRPSRDGDQFHYLWAARRCLPLLLPKGDLKAVTIESASPSDRAADGPINAGDEVIDLAEYFGSENFEEASVVRYIQLKHSTVAPSNPWLASGLAHTIKGFATRYKEIQKRLTEKKLARAPVLEFVFVSNRPVSTHLLAAVDNAAHGRPGRPTDLRKLETNTGLTGVKLTAFCKILRLEGKHDGLWDQRNILFQDIRGYLPDADVDAPTQLKELVTRKALSESASNPTITRTDVLRALKTDVDQLFPAPCLIQELSPVVPREQESELNRSIVQASGIPVIIHAAGGVGKSIIATRIQHGLPPGSSYVLYDCFGNGQYRSATHYRHRHKNALVQIANELAAEGLCHPLIPTQNAEASAYLRAFIHRLEQSVTLLKAKNSKALLCIVVDAADNAQMAAEEIGEARAFVRDLIRQKIPDGVRVVMLCRSHRQHLLDPPPDAMRVELKAFSRNETANLLRQHFPSASNPDIDEFHRLSSQNPRVQALALAGGRSLPEILRRLGPNPTTVEQAIGELLDAAISKLRDAAGTVEKDQIERICAGLAALRPLIPISVLSSMSGVDPSAIKSFAYDLGRPLIITGDAIQFFDEPAETWFRDKFKPSPKELGDFVASLKPLSAGSGYIAAALPQLMLEAGQLDELVSLALSSDALPKLSPIERRDVELQRLQFALKASLRGRRYLDAAKLALKVGGESAGDTRQRQLLQANTDLGAAFMEVDLVQEIISRRSFSSGWMGSHHAYEAALMSGKEELLGEARSRLRMASEWLSNWHRQSTEDRRKEAIANQDICELATAYFNLHGADACAQYLRGWTPRAVSFHVGRALAHRFVDHGRFDDLDRVAAAAVDDPYLALAIIVELRDVSRTPPKMAVKQCLSAALKPRFKLEIAEGWNEGSAALNAITALVETSYATAVGKRKILAKLLSRYLPKSPPRGMSTSYGSVDTPLVRAYALHAALSKKTLQLLDLAHTELRAELEKEHSSSRSSEARQFTENVGALLPWYMLWANRLVANNPKAGLAKAIAEATNASSAAAQVSYQELSQTSNDIAEIWLTILIAAGANCRAVQGLNAWLAQLRRPLFTPTLCRLARRTAHVSSLKSHALEYARRAFDLTKGEHEGADSKSQMFVSLARAVLVASRAEAEAYFDQAVEVSNKIGDENIDRWAALLNLAEIAADQQRSVPEVAYKLARCAEVTYEYVDRDKHFDWSETVRALAGLCPSSSLSILSRWRDRGFGQPERLLPVALEALVKGGAIEAKKAVPITGFRAHWDIIDVLTDALAVTATKADKEAQTSFIYRQMTFSYYSSETWRRLKDMLSGHGIIVADIDERIAEENRRNEARRATERNSQGLGRTAPRVEPRRNWGAVFRRVNLAEPNGISIARRRFREGEPPFDQGQFFAQAFSRVPVGKEADFVTALAAVPDFGLYEFRHFLENIPSAWKSRLAVTSAIANTLNTFCRRHCMEITRGRYYEVLPPKLASKLTGVTERDIVDVVLTGIGEATEIGGASRAFALVGLLASRLSENEALTALTYGLNLFNEVLKDGDGDGPWAPDLEPPAAIDAAIAGYVFGALASPRASVRWEAAHVVHAFCIFDEFAVLDHLVKLADGANHSAFADADLYFYQLHARQWLLIALARAAMDRPHAVARHSDFVLKYATINESHVLIREVAKRAAIALIDAGVVEVEFAARQKLNAINISPFATAQSKAYEQNASRLKADAEDERFYFGIDIGPYWFAPLGRCFSLSEADIEQRAADVIANDLDYPKRLHWDEDERVRRKILKYEESRHSHGSYPRADDLRFYLSYHAMMIVAGRLLATVPTHREKDSADDEFTSWLSSHGLSRQDGLWLADRRDPIPLGLHEWKYTNETDNWRNSIGHDEFDRYLKPAEGFVNVWGHWIGSADRREETVTISSALVSPDRSSALLRALQTTDDSSNYLIPPSDDDREIDSGLFQLRGWIVNRSHNQGIDEFDPWAGAISYPAPRPSEAIAKLMSLKSYADHRRWQQDGATEEALAVAIWGTFHEGDDDIREERGNRVQASREFLMSLLSTCGMDLIVKIAIERQRTYSRYESREDDEKNYTPPKARVFLIKAERNISSD